VRLTFLPKDINNPYEGFVTRLLVYYERGDPFEVTKENVSIWANNCVLVVYADLIIHILESSAYSHYLFDKSDSGSVAFKDAFYLLYKTESMFYYIILDSSNPADYLEFFSAPLFILLHRNMKMFFIKNAVNR
jgi:hypothetical protein